MNRFSLTPDQCQGRLPFSHGQDIFISTEDFMEIGVVADIILDCKENNGDSLCSVVYLVTTPIGCYGKTLIHWMTKKFHTINTRLTHIIEQLEITVYPFGCTAETTNSLLCEMVASSWMNVLNRNIVSDTCNGSCDRVYESNPAFFLFHARETEMHDPYQLTHCCAPLMCALNSDVLTVHKIESIMYASSVLSECNTNNY